MAVAVVLAAASTAGAVLGIAGAEAHFQAHATITCPAAQPAGVAVHDRVVGHVARDHRARSHEAVLPERHATHDGRVRSDRGAAPHQRLLVFGLALDVAARVDHVGEHHRRSAEHVVLEDHARVDRDVVLDLHVVADAALRGDDHVLPDVAAFADLAVLHDVAEMPDLRALADAAGLVDGGTRVCGEVRHGG